MKKYFIFLIPILLLLSGCGEDPNCSSNNNAYVTYTYDSESESCVVLSTVQKDICGNSVIEEGETYCNCPKDITKTHPEFGCDGIVGDYASKVCKNEVCVVDLNTDKVAKQTKIVDIEGDAIGFKGEMTLTNPLVFGVSTPSIIELKLILNRFVSTSTYKIKNINVNKLEIRDPANLKLGEVEINNQFSEIDDSALVKFEIEPPRFYQIDYEFVMFFTVTYDADVFDDIGTLVRTDSERVTIATGMVWPTINTDFYE